METQEEKKEIKISLWTFFILVTSVVILIAATISGWLLVLRKDMAENKSNENNIQYSIVTER